MRLLLATLKMLDEISLPNPGVFGPAKIIRRLMETNGVLDAPAVVASPEDNLSPTLDVDAIAKMFPGPSQFDVNTTPEQYSGNPMHTGMPQGRNDNMTYQNVIDDSLFGFLDDSSFGNFDEFGLQGPHMSWR